MRRWLDFNKFWSDCVCGNDGKPISDGPFILTNYTRGAGVTLKSNPDWYGTKPGLKEIDFKLITDTNSEIQAMRGGEVDAIYPSPQTALSELVEQSGLTYSSISGFTQEHWDFQFGPAQGHPPNPLLKSPWMRQAIALGIDRHSLIQALYGRSRPAEAAEQPRVRARPERDFRSSPSGTSRRRRMAPEGALHRWPVRADREQHIGLDVRRPQGGVPLHTTAGNAPCDECRDLLVAARRDRHQARRQFQPANPNFFGQTLPGNDFDIAEYAWSGGPDPSGFDAIYQCLNAATNLGGQNYKLYCNRKVDALL